MSPFSADKVDFKSFKTEDRIFGPVILFLFSLTVSFILINVFIAIIVEAFVTVRSSSCSTPSL